MNSNLNFWSRLWRLVLGFSIVMVLTGCARPLVRYVQWNPSTPMLLNTWERIDGDNQTAYWFMTPYKSVANQEFIRVTGHKADTIPLSKYGFNLWYDGDVYHLTQVKK